VDPRAVIPPAVRDYLKSHPRLYDQAKRWKRRVGASDPVYRGLLRLAGEHGRPLRFVQVGANDGLRNDPIREFVIDGGWEGILVEPLPGVFELLRRNYSRAQERLRFVNAAISAPGTPALQLYTLRASFLATLGEERRLDLLRKASTEREHLLRFIDEPVDAETVIERIEVPCMSYGELLQTHAPDWDRVDLLVLDVEGHEPEILRSLQSGGIRPNAILYESEHLGEQEETIAAELRERGYRIESLAEDSLAVSVASD